MGLFDIFKKKEEPTPAATERNKILLAMPLFKNNETYNLEKALKHLKESWGAEIEDPKENNQTAVFTINGQMVAIAFMPAPVPSGDIEGTAAYAYNWPTAIDDLKDHTGHAIVSILNSNQPMLERFKLLSILVATLMETSNVVGVYKGMQSLLIPTQQYLETVEALRLEQIPVSLWVYIGLRKSDTGNSIYSYGLTAFNKRELEVVNSKLSMEELYDFVSNIVAYVIDSDVTFKNGETLGYTQDQKIKITLSKGQFVEGDSLKLEM